MSVALASMVSPSSAESSDRYALLHDRILVVNDDDGSQLNLSAVEAAARYVDATTGGEFGLLVPARGTGPVMADELVRFMEKRFRSRLRVAWVAETSLGFRCQSIVVKLLENLQGRVFQSREEALAWLRDPPQPIIRRETPRGWVI